ncbi:hypothetical protein [Streptomyces sp. NBC_01465]|uniref:hypothetical protein n=1 Tax=Streptomyces sp. NBC_01465 TaxID=2903878 RepID=UPI002E381DC5|nr:hypothetical protein [Streptomyces sp. NBC_01465]
MSGDGYAVDPAALQQITNGINAAMSELKELGLDIEANLGRGFDDLELTGLESGHAGLTETFADFCDRWGWGVHSLMRDANELAAGLGLSAGMYHEQEQYVSTTLKVAYQGAEGNPYLSEEEVAKQGWSDTLKAPVANALNPDFSAESAEKAQQQSNEAWDQAADNAKSSPLLGAAEAAAGQDTDIDWQWDGTPHPDTKTFEARD